ncbi:hypothetical protein BJP75_00015430 [Bacteroides thetaiotaomicron]|nr:hypothetical protein [Bacteroides thetaiotaomicron]
MKNRDYSLDFLAGILLLQIIYNHCCSISKSVSIDLSFLAFYMPWFFYKGGMFFKTLESKQMLMGGKRLLLPFMKYSIIGLSIDFILSQLKDVSVLDFSLRQVKYILLQGSFFGNLPLWFLPALFGARLLSNYFVNHKWNMILSVTLLYTVSILLNYIQVNVTSYIPYMVCTICTGTMFFLLGALLKDIQYDKHIFLISGFVYITFLYFGIPIIDMRTNLTVHGFYCLWLPFSVSGCLFFNNIVHHISVRFIESEYNLFTCVGTNSMTYYVWHWIFLLPANYLLINIIHVPKEYCLLFTLMIVALCLFLVRKKTI